MALGRVGDGGAGSWRVQSRGEDVGTTAEGIGLRGIWRDMEGYGRISGGIA